MIRRLWSLSQQQPAAVYRRVGHRRMAHEMLPDTTATHRTAIGACANGRFEPRQDSCGIGPECQCRIPQPHRAPSRLPQGRLPPGIFHGSEAGASGRDAKLLHITCPGRTRPKLEPGDQQRTLCGCSGPERAGHQTAGTTCKSQQSLLQTALQLYRIPRWQHDRPGRRCIGQRQ